MLTFNLFEYNGSIYDIINFWSYLFAANIDNSNFSFVRYWVSFKNDRSRCPWIDLTSKRFFYSRTSILCAPFRNDSQLSATGSSEPSTGFTHFLTVPNCEGIKFHFWTNFATYFTLLFSIFTNFDLKRISPFMDFEKFHHPHPCYYNPLTIRHGTVCSSSGVSLFYRNATGAACRNQFFWLNVHM